jgi:hypothetical protein
MANKFAIATGNWNNTAIWNDGVVPTVGDDVWANSFNITLNTDISVNSIRSNISPIDLPFNPIPLMTSNTAPSGVASAGTFQVGFEAWKAFDQNDLTSWASNGGVNSTSWVSYQLASAVIAKRYFILKVAAATNRPSSWRFEGSNDGSSWTTLDTVTGDSSVTYLSGTLANTTAYLYYRIFVTAVSAGSSAQIFTFEISTDTSSPLGNSNGGSFIVNSNRTITCTDPSFGIYSGSATTLSIQSSGATININSNIPSGSTNTINIVDIPSVLSTGNTVNIVGNLTAISTNVIPFRTTAPNTTINVTGNVNSVGTSNTILVAATATNTNITITGDLATSVGNNVLHSSTGNIILIGNILSPGAGYGIATTGGANITVTGNVFGSLASYGNGIQTTIISTITVNGDVFGQNASAISTSVASTIIINGNVSTTASAAFGIVGVVTTTVRVSGNITNSTTRSAIFAGNIQLIGTTQFLQAKDASGNNKFLYSPGTDLGNPAAEDVRSGTDYAGGTLTGTLAVPPTPSVAVGVPVDNTFGTGIFTIGDMGALLASYLV